MGVLDREGARRIAEQVVADVEAGQWDYDQPSYLDALDELGHRLVGSALSDLLIEPITRVAEALRNGWPDDVPRGERQRLLRLAIFAQAIDVN
jgi:hypothetical protein